MRVSESVRSRLLDRGQHGRLQRRSGHNDLHHRVWRIKSVQGNNNIAHFEYTTRHIHDPESGSLVSARMSGRLFAARVLPVARRAVAVYTPQRLAYHWTSGGLLRTDGAQRLMKKRTWPLGAYALHNLPAVRSMSFVRGALRVFPRLATKFAMIGTAAGGATIAGIAYLQNQATRMEPISEQECVGLMM